MKAFLKAFVEAPVDVTPVEAVGSSMSSLEASLKY